MEDLKNKSIRYKVMFVPNEESIIWDVFSETPLPVKTISYNLLNSFINIEEWKKIFGIKFYKWLNDDDLSIFDINNAINVEMINALKEVNNHLSDEYIFFWFDRDRTYLDNYKWVNCPISGLPLIDLGPRYPDLNRLISPNHPLIFPIN